MHHRDARRAAWRSRRHAVRTRPGCSSGWWARAAWELRVAYALLPTSECPHFRSDVGSYEPALGVDGTPVPAW